METNEEIKLLLLEEQTLLSRERYDAFIHADRFGLHLGWASDYKIPGGILLLRCGDTLYHLGRSFDS